MSLSDTSEHAMSGIMRAITMAMTRQLSTTAKQQVLTKLSAYLRNIQHVCECNDDVTTGSQGKNRVEVAVGDVQESDESDDSDYDEDCSELVSTKRLRVDHTASGWSPSRTNGTSSKVLGQGAITPSLVMVKPKREQRKPTGEAPTGLMHLSAAAAAAAASSAAPASLPGPAANLFEYRAAQTAQGIQSTHLNGLTSGLHWRAPNPVYFPSSVARDGSGASASTPPSLHELVDKLVTPGRATDTSNDICASILLHPNFACDPSVLGMYSKMNAGLRNYVPGTAHVWLYTPRKRSKNASEKDVEYASEKLALVFVYPDEFGPPSIDDIELLKPKNKLHFGGRAYPLCNNSVLLQHGAHKPLR
jgi:hypothetical protein